MIWLYLCCFIGYNEEGEIDLFRIDRIRIRFEVEVLRMIFERKEM